FQSLDPPLALQRAVRLLNVPETVALAIEDDQLVLNGVASRQWLESVRGLLDRVPGFRMINIDRVKVDDSSRLRSIRHQLRAPETVQLELSYNTLFVTGTASAEWIKSLKQRCLSLFPDLNLKTTFHGDKLLSNEGTQLKILIQQLDGMSFYFSRGVTLTTAQQSSLEEKIDRLRKLVLAIDDVSTGVKFIVRGYTDGSGSVESNKALQLMRANYVKQFMLKAGISPASITVISGRNSVSVLQVNPALRRADIEIIADDVV
ncbi:MAG TPA: hypothetical protein ENJ32_08625, partial [Crenotrichaceae bacterium]|nr:hypothetical protein [Crenotrichaceae bacterium]